MAGFDFIFKNMPELELDESKKKVLLIYIAAVCGIFILYFLIFLKPSVTKLFSVIPKVRQRRIEMKVVTGDLEHRNKLELKIKNLEKKEDAYEKSFSKEKEIPMLLENLSKIAKSSGVKISGIKPINGSPLRKPQEAEKEKDYQEVPIAVTAQSGYHELGKFINKLENDTRFMQVSDIKIEANDKNPRRHDIEFVVYAYTIRESE